MRPPGSLSGKPDNRFPSDRDSYDYEYVRNGTADLFMMFEPLSGRREVTVSQSRTRQDFANCLRDLAGTRYPQAEKIVLVMDNLNTHTLASLYAAFPPQEARELAGRFEIHHTPKHGSWLNMAELEIGILSRQCLSRRIATIERMSDEVDAWVTQRNQAQSAVHWQFTTADARIKLQHLYPKF
jgi:hypothetical protein